MDAVTELASEVGASAACQALCLPRASYYRVRRKTSFPRRPGRGCLTGTHSVRRNANRSWLVCTKNASRIARRPLFMRRYSMKGNISCSIRSMYRLLEKRGGSPASVAIS